MTLGNFLLLLRFQLGVAKPQADYYLVQNRPSDQVPKSDLVTSNERENKREME